MYDHIGLKVSDLAKSVRFYTGALEALGFECCSHNASSAGFGPEGAPALWLYPQKNAKGAGTHVAFRATSRAAVDDFHKSGVAGGGRDNGAPGVRADYGPKYYAAFLIDPDGNNVEAVCMK